MCVGGGYVIRVLHSTRLLFGTDNECEMRVLTLAPFVVFSLSFLFFFFFFISMRPTPSSSPSSTFLINVAILGLYAEYQNGAFAADSNCWH